MGKIKKKGESGAAKNFINRTQAVKRLQISLADFRRLCIFKGIYPREPRSKKKANKGSTAPTTFYYTKDIQYLMHEPVIQKFRDHKVFARKLSKALGRGDVGDAKRLEENRPRYKLDHIIKERYPSFADALRDLDDPLCMLFLFAAMPATDKISQRITEEADKLCNQWMAYVAREGLLRKVFVSIKGVYYEANVRGEEIRWLVPFRFPQNIPSDIDFRIMLTFLEFYTTLLGFVLYRLYTEADLVYPPTISSEKIKGVGGISAYILKSKEANNGFLGEVDSKVNKAKSEKIMSSKKLKLDKAMKADEKSSGAAEELEDEEEGAEEELDEFHALPNTETAVSDVLAQPKASDSQINQLFSSFTFYIGREVALDIMEFLILAFGGKFIAEAALDELEGAAKDIDLSSVTHQICDRPAISSKVPGRTYIQPQWIFDSINKSKLLPVSDYAIGESLPPHLSPWGDRVGYDPEAPLNNGEEDEDLEEEDEDVDEVEEADEEDEEVDEEERENLVMQKELEKEAKGIKYSESDAKEAKKSKKSKKRSPEEVAAEEEKELRKMMMSNKQKKMYNSVQNAVDKKKDREEELRKKRRKIEATKKKLSQSHGQK